MKKFITGFLFLVCLNTALSFELADAIRITDSVNTNVLPEQYVILEKNTQKLSGSDIEIIRSAYYCLPGEYCQCRGSYSCIDSRYGLRLNGKLLLKPVFNLIITWGGNALLVRFRDRAWIIDFDGQPISVIQCVDCYHSYFAVEKDGKKGVIDKNFEEIIPFEYEAVGDRNNYVTFVELNSDLETTSELSTYPVKKNGKWGIIDDRNKIRCPFDYDAIDPDYWSDMITVKKGTFWGVIDFAQRVIIPFEFDSILFYDSRYFLKKGEKWGTMQVNESASDVEFVYDEILFPGCGDIDFFAQKGNLWFGIAESGGVGFEDDYTGILIYHTTPYNFPVPYYAIQKDGKWGIYSCDGRAFITDFSYKKIIGVDYTRGQLYNEYGELIVDYPVYTFTLLEGNEEVTLRLSDYE